MINFDNFSDRQTFQLRPIINLPWGHAISKVLASTGSAVLTFIGYKPTNIHAKFLLQIERNIFYLIINWFSSSTGGPSGSFSFDLNRQYFPF